MALAPLYRDYALPWEGDPESGDRFRKLVIAGLVLLLLIGSIVPWLKFPEQQASVEAVPDRLARLMVEEQPKPPPPPPPPPVEEPKPRDETKPVPKPEQKVEQARRKAEQSLSRVRDELADLRREFADLPQPTTNLTGAVNAESRAERSLIASKVGSGSSGVQSADSSRGFGGGAGALSDHATGAVESSVAKIGTGNDAKRTGNSGKAARSQEDIEQEFDKHKGAIYALYSRALRERPELKGKMVLEFTIAPSGEVTACRVVSSELDDPELERKIIARVKLIRYSARDVPPITTTKPIEFFPA
jgi:TonB family protein